MDLFFHACQGLGLALAIGIVAGAIGGTWAERGALALVIGVAVSIVGGLVWGQRLTQADVDHPAWPGWPVGFVATFFALYVACNFVQGAVERAGEDGSAGTTAALVGVAGLVLAGLVIVIPPISLVALVGIIYLWFAQRRRAAQKHAGLRSIR